MPDRPVRRRGFLRRAGRGAGLLISFACCYAALAYGLLPAMWRHYEHHRPLESAPKITRTSEGLAGDPLNVALVGTQDELVRAMLSTGWHPADPITFRTSLAIARSVLLKRPYPQAPVSNLYLWGRHQDLAFQQAVGPSAQQRHHVRWWRAEQYAVQGRPLWIGAVTFDRSVGISHWTGKVTHHIAPDIDAERDKLLADLEHAGQLVQVYQVTGVGPAWHGRNGGGDPYYTDGELSVGVLSTGNAVRATPAQHLANPPVVQLKTTLWSWLRPVLN